MPSSSAAQSNSTSTTCGDSPGPMSDIARLEEILEAEAQGYSAFVTRLPLKTALIKKGQLAALEAFLAREADEQCKLRQLERERTEISASIAESLGLAPGTTLTQILAKLPPEQRSRLSILRERLLDQSAKLQDGNERCEILLNASLEFVKYSLELIGTILNPEERLADMLYGPEVQGPAKSGSVLLNRTA